MPGSSATDARAPHSGVAAMAAPVASPVASPAPRRADAWRRSLIAQSDASHNASLIASMLASQQTGAGAMPDRLGLEPDDFSTLLARYFPALQPAALQHPGRLLEPDRADERDELVRLLLNDTQEPPRSRRWLARMVAAGCMGGNHLWQDLGLWGRDELSGLMELNFPELAKRNTADMKWKRFLYKQLCETEGIYTCRSPSCEVCVDYHACFGPEN
jgi:nitrogen fixation protein NifQ